MCSVTSEQEIEIVESVAAVSEETTGAGIEKINLNLILSHHYKHSEEERILFSI